jgi:uncharacterized protein YbjT (DUF2867 family)
MGRRALVIGGSGLVGSHVLQRLSEHGFGVVSLVRRPSGRDGERVVDFAQLREEDVEGCDDLVCALGTTMKKAGSREAFRAVDFELPMKVATLARRCGVTQMAVVSSVGASPASESFYLKTKGELEVALKGLGFEHLHILRPSFLLGDRGEARVLERAGIAIARLAQGLLAGGLRRYRPIHADTVARAIVRCLESPREERGMIYEHDAILAAAQAG